MRVFLGLVAIVGFLFGSVVVAKTDYDNVGDISKKIQENTKQIHKKVKKRKVVQQDLYTLRRDIKLTDLKKKNALKKLDNARVELKQLKRNVNLLDFRKSNTILMRWKYNQGLFKDQC